MNTLEGETRVRSVRPAAVVVLAAGHGKRMRSTIPKALHEIGGRSLLGHVLAAAAPLGADRTVVVVGHGRDEVKAHLAEIAPAAEAVVQAEQRGTGHAVRVALEALEANAGTVVVLNADVPLLRQDTLAGLVAEHASSGRAGTVLTARVEDPTGLGRIVRDGAGELAEIVEESDCDDLQRTIHEINAGIYVFDAAAVRDALSRLSTTNAQGEEYLTDAVAMLVREGRGVGTYAGAAEEALGCNDRIELARLGALLRDAVLRRWMAAGVTVIDPATTWVDVTVELAADAVLLPGVQLHGETSVAAGAEIGPDSTLTDTLVGPGAKVIRAHCMGARIGERVSVGPFAYLRPGTVLDTAAKIGTFVEVKGSQVGAGSKVPHLSYVGDATIGEQSNIGAASVFVNYDGVHKHRTVVGSHCRMGSDNMYVAPVTIGDGAYSGAGTVILGDVPAGALAIPGAKPRVIEGWVERKRPGTAAAEAAARAAAEQNQGE
ncbi:bifunctional UDP-N-acetylglucosamine diphosphorylase/glucosamine-1-phosphate N-acetyltransferase GlmU [Fodinicola feengrottensis]|uniref:Bifunctional protein GlmU n=1 Tax=Fodinicola feengrottensis TaxID=435914 RepID=A0ABN2HJK8_9ACTN